MRWKSLLAVSALLALLIASSAFGQNKSGSSNPSNLQSVLVINGTGAPVPTVAQGTTNVSGSVSLSSGTTVNIGNTPTVTVGNMPNVNVANTPTVSLVGGASVGVTNPLDGQNNPTPLATLDAAQPYEDVCIMAINEFGYGACSFQVIPSGKRLVIQEFDASGTLQAGARPIYLYLTTQPGFDHHFAATFMGTGFGYDNFVTHQETRLYSLQNSTPTCSAAVTNPSNSSFYKCYLSGFLVDVP
jgi:hypothetical protein